MHKGLRETDTLGSLERKKSSNLPIKEGRKRNVAVTLKDKIWGYPVSHSYAKAAALDDLGQII